jgi:hypothetical protein
VGHTDEESGNKEARWLPGSNQLRIRLPDRLARERVDKRGVSQAGTQEKSMPLGMQRRFVVLDSVDFTSHKGAARAALLNAFGEQPVKCRPRHRGDGFQPGVSSLPGRKQCEGEFSLRHGKDRTRCWCGL